MKFKLEDYNKEVPVAYIPTADDRISVKQEIVDVSELSFRICELIFDLNDQGQVIGVELL